ncbi:MAG: hypothetical protein COA79_19350 [Planctomycetota bacterium]|nr:MAG: hypothetical protein COA79_19350 [Planctomycetota bacterium]
MPPKVLLAHPDKNFRYELHKVLSANKYSVVEADNGGAMFTITKMQNPDFIIAADGMSSLSTADYLKKLKELDIGPIPIILFTAKRNTLRDLTFLNTGVSEILVEPISESELLFHLERLQKPFLSTDSFVEETNVQGVLGKNENTSQVNESSPIGSDILKQVSHDVSELKDYVKPENSSLLLRQSVCQFCKSSDLVRMFALKTRTILDEPDKFDVDLYKTSIGSHEYIDYSLLDVCVCQTCLFSSNDFTMFDIQGAKAKELMVFSEFVCTSFQKIIDERKLLIKNISETFFTEHRTPEEAIISNDLAIHALNFLYGYDKMKYSWTQNEIFQYELKSGAIADKYHLNEIRNSKYKEAYEFGLNQMSLKGELGVRRHSIQMLALSALMKSPDNVYKFGKELYDHVSRTNISPQLRIKTREYIDRAKKYFGWVEDESYWK